MYKNGAVFAYNRVPLQVRPYQKIAEPRAIVADIPGSVEIDIEIHHRKNHVHPPSRPENSDLVRLIYQLAECHPDIQVRISIGKKDTVITIRIRETIGGEILEILGVIPPRTCGWSPVQKAGESEVDGRQLIRKCSGKHKKTHPENQHPDVGYFFHRILLF